MWMKSSNLTLWEEKPVQRLMLPDACINTPSCEHKPRPASSSESAAKKEMPPWDGASGWISLATVVRSCDRILSLRSASQRRNRYRLSHSKTRKVTLCQRNHLSW